MIGKIIPYLAAVECEDTCEPPQGALLDYGRYGDYGDYGGYRGHGFEVVTVLRLQ
jgi:hypothetical protein